MNATDHKTFDSWLAAYGDAWEARDPRAAAELFGEEATYRETPFAEPARGREAITEYWSRVTREHQQVRYDHEILAVAEDMGIARW
jgi:nuclear transport factor 2 (NTF2) superfamily protein